MKIALLLLGLALCLSPALSGIPIPNTPDGYQQGSNDAPVVFEFFGDLMCPVTAAVYPTMKQIISHYGPNKLKFLFHAYSLPYHRNAFLSNKGTWVIAANNISNVFTYIESVMAHQVDLFNAPSANMSTNDVLNYLAKLVETDGLMTAAQFLAGMDDDNVDLNAIGSWKYGASRAVTGTPTTIVNGAVVDSDSSWTLSDWQQVLDPLYPAAHQLTCPSGSVACDYAPGKEECCLAGEFCIKNEGCTCAKDMSKLACRARAAAANSTCHTGFTACHSEAGAQCCMAGEFCEKKKGCTRKEHADALSCAAEPKDMMAKETCTPPNVPCEYLPGKTQCCLPGEMCLHNVGCRCALGEKHVKPMKMVPAKKHTAPHAPQPLCKSRKAGQIDAGQCTAPNVPCQYLPGKTQCCLPGEACIHNVGCRCAVEEQKPKEEPKAPQPLCKARKVGQVDAGQCTAPNVPCQYLPGKTQCCLPGEACIHNVGCRCAVEEQKPKEEKEAPRPLCRSRKAGQVDAGQCAAPNVPCEYLPGKTQCCLPGEACIHNVGCRCAVEEKPKKAHKSPKAPQPLCRHRKAGQIDAGQCTPPNVPCEYLPGKTQCCLAGEACIHNVGCRCAASLKQDEDVIFPPHDETALCNVDPKKDAFAAPPKCPDTQFPCEYLKDKWSCCFAGDFCIRNVGCQC